jgi:hypothetical protein
VLPVACNGYLAHALGAASGSFVLMLDRVLCISQGCRIVPTTVEGYVGLALWGSMVAKHDEVLRVVANRHSM